VSTFFRTTQSTDKNEAMQPKHDIKQINGGNVVVVTDDNLIITEVQQFLQMMMNLPSDRVILHEKNLHPHFFELRTGLAGEILQKVVNYACRLGIVGDFSKYSSKALRDFIYESNKGNVAVFVTSVDEALTRLSK
jgi:hypothetical protein